MPKWQLAGTKHHGPVSYRCNGSSSYLLDRGTLFGLDLARRWISQGGVESMATGERGHRRDEKRRAPRYRYQAALEIEWGSAWLKGRTRDISAGGMFIESEDVLWVGAGFRARMSAQRALWLECSV